MPKRLGDGGFEVQEIDWLGHEIEGAPVHRGADIGHVAIGRDDDGRKSLLGLLQLLQQRQPIHPRHIDVGDHEVDVTIGLESSQRVDTVTGEQEADRSVPHLVTKLLQDESLQIRLVVDDQNPCGHAARSTRVSISLRSDPKSIGLVSSASAPLSSALRLVSASP